MTLPVNPGPEPFIPVPPVPRPTEPEPDKPSDPTPEPTRIQAMTACSKKYEVGSAFGC
jgi:hypothetical protein